MPSVDTVKSFGVAKASRFGLLQHPITLASQMATSAADRKVTGRNIAVWSKFLRPRLRSPRHAAMVFEGWSALARRSIFKRLD
jgi:hypothetical protein